MECIAERFHVFEMGESGMRPTWTYKLGEHIISIKKKIKDLGVVIQDNLLPEKHIDKIFVYTFIMLKNIRMTFHFLEEDMVRKL